MHVISLPFKKKSGSQWLPLLVPSLPQENTLTILGRTIVSTMTITSTMTMAADIFLFCFGLIIIKLLTLPLQGFLPKTNDSIV